MLNIKQIAKEFNNDLNNLIIANPDFQKAKAFGKAEAFLKSAESFKVNGQKLTKFALYAYEMDKGRGKTQNKTGGLYEAIYEWVGLKKYGITYKSENERKSITFAIVRKMSQFGSYKFRNKGAQTNIYTPAIEKSVQDLQKKIATKTAESVLFKLNL